MTKSTYVGAPWRSPDEESHIYPGLCLHDGRVSGSITVGCSRLPLWAFAGWPWDEVVKSWDYVEAPGYEWAEERHGLFLCDLLEQRGEFGRLLLVLADEERRERNRSARNDWRAWWEMKRSRKRVRDQLQRCLDALDEED